MQPNVVLSKELQVKRLLKADEKAVFVLLNLNKTENGREEKTVPEFVSLSKQKTVYDPFAEGGPKRVIIGNVVGSEPRETAEGKSYLKLVTRPLEFIRGFCILGSESNETYQYAMRRPDCESNPFGKVMAVKASERKAVYKLSNDKREISNALLLEDMRFAAQKLIRETSSITDLKTIATKLNTSPDVRMHIRAYNPPLMEDPQAIKLELLQKVSMFSKQIIYASNDVASKYKVQIFEGVNAGVLILQDGMWSIIGDKIANILQPSPEVEKTDARVEYFRTDEDGKKDYVKFTQALKKALRAE